MAESQALFGAVGGRAGRSDIFADSVLLEII